jgi:signal transduction histidine kinase
LPPNDSEDDSAAVAGMLHDVIAQALFRADLALSDLSDRIPPGSFERELADEALESVLAALRDVRRAIGQLRSGVPIDGR